MVGRFRLSTAASKLRKPGKQVGDALYLHCSAIGSRNSRRVAAVDSAVRLAGIGRQAFNVVKLRGKDLRRISLLAYQGFDLSPFPALLDSWTVDLTAKSASHRSYRASRNPPILHRKELLLPLDDPRRKAFGDLTEALENRGLFIDPKSIGFRRQWETRLREARIAIVNHEVVDVAGADSSATETGRPVARHRTAISRPGLSAPMKALDRHGFLNGNYTLFDYGCGRGGDLAALAAAGIPACGWDPYFAPDAPLKASDLVNLGFVLNVIEEPQERTEVLQAAYKLARRLLSIAVMTSGRMPSGQLLPHRDGFLTTRGTFQRSFSQQELRTLVEGSIGEEAIAVGPGVFFVFRDKVLEQRFLDRRRRRSPAPAPFRTTVPPVDRRPVARAEALLEENRELVDSMWQRALELGRLPHLDELQSELGHEILARLGSLAKATRLACAVHDGDDLAGTAQARTDDLTLYFALNLFGNRQRYRELPLELQRDVRAFFGSYANAQSCARKLLFSLADPEVLEAVSAEAQADGVGHFDGMGSIQVDSRLLDHLPIELRAYVGCAEQLYGDISEADLVRLKLGSRKVTLLKYHHYEVSPLPLLRERVKIDLRRQRIRIHDYGRRGPAYLLYMKSLYMDESLPGFSVQRAFDKKLASLGLLRPEAPDPPWSEFARILWQRRLAIRGYDIVPIRESTLSDNPGHGVRAQTTPAPRRTEPLSNHGSVDHRK